MDEESRVRMSDAPRCGGHDLTQYHMHISYPEWPETDPTTWRAIFGLSSAHKRMSAAALEWTVARTGAGAARLRGRASTVRNP